jgi:purine-binding chemotaxis protein CheW
MFSAFCCFVIEVNGKISALLSRQPNSRINSQLIMASKPYLIFSQGNSQYGIDASLVKEIFPLPELKPVPEAPTDIIGILNLRGEVLPVMHLGLRLGRSALRCKVTDQIVVLDWRGLQIGMVVEQVQELQTIEGAVIQSQPDYGRERNINPAFIAGIAKLESELIVLLDPETLIREPDRVATMIWESQIPQMKVEPEAVDGGGFTEDSFEQIFDDDLNDALDLLVETDFDATAFAVPQPEAAESGADTDLGDFYNRYCPHATTEEREIFRRRAENLRLPLIDLTDSTGLYPLAVVDLGGESFGIDLKSIQEFTSIRNLTHIPCCPSHIVGNMNLRGEIVTLVDIRSVLNLRGSSVQIGTQTVVVQVKDIVAGLPVDRVSDVLYINPNEIKPVPIAVPAGAEGYLQGTVSLFGTTLSVLDLPKLLTGDLLLVNESI